MRFMHRCIKRECAFRSLMFCFEYSILNLSIQSIDYNISVCYVMLCYEESCFVMKFNNVRWYAPFNVGALLVDHLASFVKYNS